MSRTTYRERLYRRYSATFGVQKEQDAARQWAAYDYIYRSLPDDRSTPILDLGCGKGDWVRWLHRRGFTDVVGVDGSSEDIAGARSHGDARFVEANALEFLSATAAGSVGVVHLKDVVEHLTRDELFVMLDQVHRVLRPGGRIWLLTFNAQSPLSGATRYGDLTHELGLTPSSMAQALRAADFTGIKVSGYHYCTSSIGGTLRRVAGGGIFAASRFILRTRHGDGARVPGIDVHCALPDLFGIASRP